MSEKKLTVITWDANYREDISMGIKCLDKQTIRDQIEFIHIEWGNKCHPLLEKTEYIKKYYLNRNFPKTRPSFDTGVQWNYGLHVSTTPWVSYCHLDIIPSDFYEKMLNQIQEIENKKQNIIYIEGWFINQQDTGNYAEYKRWCNNLGDNIDLLPYKYTPKSPPTNNGIGVTIKKIEFIKEYGGWFYNVPHRSEWWTGPGLPQKKYNNMGLRNHLLKSKRAICTHPDLIAFKIPHPKPTGNYHKHNTPIEKGGIKDYNNFLKEWIPKYNKNIIKN